MRARLSQSLRAWVWGVVGSALLTVGAWAIPDFSGAPFPIYEKLHNLPPAQRTPAVQKSLLERSGEVLAAGLNRYALDVRYANTIQRICANLEPNLGSIFPQAGGIELRFIEQMPPYRGSYPFQSNYLGRYTPTAERLVLSSLAVNDSYNMFSLHRVILIDSFLLDALYRVAQYKAFTGNYDNPYEQALASYAAGLSSYAPARGSVNKFSDISTGLLVRPGASVDNPYLPFNRSYNIFSTRSGLTWDQRSFHSIEREGGRWANPAHLPVPKGYDPNLYEREAQRSFERLLAPILCHEISHCLLEHARQRLEKTFSLKTRLDRVMSAQEANAQVRRYLNENLSNQQEREADIYGAKLGRSIGLRVQDFEEGFWFLNLIEKSQSKVNVIDSHPQYIERRRLVEQVYSGQDVSWAQTQHWSERESSLESVPQG